MFDPADRVGGLKDAFHTRGWLPQQRVLHVPGMRTLCDKHFLPKLAARSARMAGVQPFSPEAFAIPSDETSFMKLIRDYRWVMKSGAHRGVSLLPETATHLPATFSGVVQRLVEPVLVDGYATDVGVYVLVAGVAPLRVYLWDDVLLRTCLKRFPTSDRQFQDLERWVVDNYQPFHQLPSVAGPAVEHLANLELWEGVMGMRGLPEFMPQVRSYVAALFGALEAELRDHPQAHAAFFDLLRLDFVVDRSGKAWLLEANMSPNLLPKNERDLAMKRRLVRETLAVVGIPRHDTRPRCHPRCTLEECSACEGCRGGGALAGEYWARGGWGLIFPRESVDVGLRSVLNWRRIQEDGPVAVCGQDIIDRAGRGEYPPWNVSLPHSEMAQDVSSTCFVAVISWTVCLLLVAAVGLRFRGKLRRA